MKTVPTASGWEGTRPTRPHLETFGHQIVEAALQGRVKLVDEHSVGHFVHEKRGHVGFLLRAPPGHVHQMARLETKNHLRNDIQWLL